MAAHLRPLRLGLRLRLTGRIYEYHLEEEEEVVVRGKGRE